MADSIDGGTGTGTGTGVGTPASTTPATGTQTPPVSTSVSTSTGIAPAPTGFTYKEDRSTWVPSHRISEESTKRQRAESELETTRRQLQAITGATPKSADVQRVEEIKEQFYQLFPNAKDLLEMSKADLDALRQAPQQAHQASEFVTAGWARHGKQMLSNVVDKANDAIGGEMSARAANRVKAAFIQMIETENELGREQGRNTPVMQKYLDGDESLVEDFIKEWSEDFLAPARRQNTAQQLARVQRVPQSGTRTQVSSLQRPTEFKTLDERLDYAAQLFKERGGEFGR